MNRRGITGKSLLVLTIILVATVLGGCRDDKPVDESGPAPAVSATGISTAGGIMHREERKVTKGFVVWNFATGNEGFAADKAGTLSAQDGLLIWKPSPDNRLISPDQLQLPAAAVHTLEFRLRSTKAQSLSLIWRTAEGEIDDKHRVTIPLIADGAFHDYQMELGQIDGWGAEIRQLAFSAAGEEGEIAIDFMRATGIYFVPFPFLKGKLDADMKILAELKETFAESHPSVIVGFSAVIEYFSDTDEAGNYMYYNNERESFGTFNPYYLVKLAKAADMPVMIWLRGDPWSYSQYGAYGELFKDDNNLMWAADGDGRYPYRNTESGYAYLSLARTEMSGEETLYWKQTDKLLSQAAEEVALLIRNNPDDILGVTTTSEYKYYDIRDNRDLDYNPKTIAEFRNYCREIYHDISQLNEAMGTAFATYELKSTDFDPDTIENPEGFDAPHVRNQPPAFWEEWRKFRVLQITGAVARQVKNIAKSIDSKYIYTHQIAYGDDAFVSPASTGNIPGSNVGIDMFNHEVRDELFQEIAGYVKGDASRSWGIPEWLIMATGDYDATYRSLELMARYKIKYISPFNWGGGDAFDFKNSAAIPALQQFLKQIGERSVSK